MIGIKETRENSDCSRTRTREKLGEKGITQHHCKINYFLSLIVVVLRVLNQHSQNQKRKLFIKNQKKKKKKKRGVSRLIVKRTNRVIKRKKLIGLLLRRVLGSTVLKVMVKMTKRSHVIP
mgnify:CR=1 FL=1